MYSLNLARPSHLRVEDATDDDPSVWQYYADGLKQAYDYLRQATSDLGNDGSYAEFEAEVAARKEIAMGYVQTAASDDRMRRADMIELSAVINASRSTTRSGAVTAMGQEIIRVTHAMLKGHRAANSRVNW